MIEAIKGILSKDAKPKIFGEYLKAIGLGEEEEKDNKEDIKQQKTIALSIAEEITSLDQQKKGDHSENGDDSF